MKRLVFVMIFSVLIVTMCSISAQGSEAGAIRDFLALDDETQINEFTFMAPSNWRKVEAKGTSDLYYYPTNNNSDGVFSACFRDVSIAAGEEYEEKIFSDFFAGLANTNGVDKTSFNIQKCNAIDGYPVRKATYTQNIKGVIYDVYTYGFYTENAIYAFMLLAPSPMSLTYHNYLDEIVTTIRLTADRLTAEEDGMMATFEPSVIYSGNDVTISVVGITEGQKETDVDFIFENTSDINYNFYAHAYAVNGVMSDKGVYEMKTNVPAKKKALSTLSISKEWMAYVGIDNVEYVDVLFWAYADDYKSFDTGVVKAQGASYSGDYTWGHESRAPDYTDDYISVYGLIDGGADLSVGVVNTSDKFVTVTMDNASVNDWGYDVDIQVYDDYVLPGCIRYCEVSVDSDYISKMGISTIDTFEFTLDVRPMDDYYGEYTTPAIQTVKQP